MGEHILSVDVRLISVEEDAQHTTTYKIQATAEIL